MDKGRLAGLISKINRRLIQNLGPPGPRKNRPPLDELILTILSQNTTDKNAYAAFRRLRSRFSTWEELLSSQPEEVAELIRPAGLGPTKARRLMALLEGLKREDASLRLDFLHEWPVERAYEFLTGFSGVGLKTAACVLLFACGKPTFPVDTHVFRVAKRLGIDNSSRTRDELQRFLEKTVPDNERYSLHINLIRLGRTICTARRPKCSDCFLCDLCRSCRTPSSGKKPAKPIA